MSEKIPRALRAAAGGQAGVVTRKQALAAGMSVKAIRCHLASGAWRQVHRGVYTTLTGVLTREARLWAALLYAGPGALLSHETAAAILGLTDTACPVIQVTIPATRRVQAPQGVVIHLSAVRYQRWPPLPGYPPHTFFEDTVIDLVDAAENLDDAAGWVTRAFGGNAVSAFALKAVADARKKLRWRDQLDEMIAAAADGAHSILEYRYDRFVVRAHGLPEAQKQAQFTRPDGRRGYRDRRYEKYGLLVELDGKRYHAGERRGADQDRDNHATAGGDATLRYGWEDVTLKACGTAAQLFAALRRRGYEGTIKPCSAACTAVMQGSAAVLRHDRESV